MGVRHPVGQRILFGSGASNWLKLALFSHFVRIRSAFFGFPHSSWLFPSICFHFSRFFFDSMCCARTSALHCGNEKQKVNASRVFFAAIPAPCPKMPPRAKYVPTYGQLGAPKSRLERPKSRKKRPKGATNAARREKCDQEALKTEKRANIVPT